MVQVFLSGIYSKTRGLHLLFNHLLFLSFFSLAKGVGLGF